MKFIYSLLLGLLTMSSYAADVSFERTYYNNIVLTNVKINNGDKVFRFIFDTGSTESFLSTEASKHITDLTIITKKKTISDGHGETEISNSAILDVSIDDFKFPNTVFNIADDYLATLGCNIDGVIGYNVIKNATWSINNQSISVYKSTSKIPTFNPHNFYKQKMIITSGVPLVYMAFGSYYSTPFLFDTGFNGLLSIAKRHHSGREMSSLFIKKGATQYNGLGIETGTSLGLVGSYNDSLKVLKIPNIRFGVSIKKDNMENSLLNALSYIESDEEATLPYIVGAEIFDYYDIVIDGKKKSIYTKITDHTYNHDFNTSFGLSIIPISNGVYKAGAIWDHSQAKGKIKPNDLILRVNDIDLTDTNSLICNTYKELLIELSSKKSIQMKIKTDQGDVISITLERNI